MQRHHAAVGGAGGGGGGGGKMVKQQQRNKLLRMYDKCAVFESLDTGSCLVATRIKEGGTRDLQVVDRSHLPDYGGPSQVMPFEAIFGIYDLLSGSYVALVVESEPFVSVSVMQMRRAKKVLIVPLFRNGKVLSESKQRDENRYLQLLHMAFSEHQFFFSFTSDVTLTQQRIAKFSAKEMEHKHIYTRADPRFFWNSDVINDLAQTNGADEWIVPFMSAHVEVRPECEVEGEKFTLLFISRRSRYRQGCRFTKRGIDEQGNVANFVETEQMLIFGDGKISSFVQVRGSIPVLWSSPVLMKYEPKVYIDSNKARIIEYAEKHVDDLLTQYADDRNHSRIVFVNLVDMKKDQEKLGIIFKEVVETIRGRLHGDSLMYVWFDFHKETKSSYKNLSKLVDLVDEQFRAQKFFQKQANGTVTSWQVGVMRTNCMDNLDRTNVVQSLFARRSLLTQLGKLSAVPSSSSGSSTGSVLDSPFKAFEKIYKTVWANNADAISMGYAGTGALKVDFTKTGKRTLVGMFNDGVNSVMRYYINNFTDGIKQDAIDLLLGNYHPDPSSPSPFTPRPGQETLSTNLIKGFVLMSIIFSALMLFSPSPHDSTSLVMHLLISIGVTSLVNMYIFYAVVKSGSKIGERIVLHPQLRPEPLPQK